MESRQVRRAKMRKEAREKANGVISGAVRFKRRRLAEVYFRNEWQKLWSLYA